MAILFVGIDLAKSVVAVQLACTDFKCCRQLSAWLVLVPGQYSSGGRTRLGRITKSGDAYLRSLLVLGARSLLQAAKDKSDSVSR